MSDNSTREVTNESQWTSSNTGVATVNSTGRVTIVSGGPVEIRATYQSVVGSRAFTAAPRADLELLGVVRHLGSQAGIGGVRLEVTAGPNQGQVTTSDGNGFYIFRGLQPGPFGLRGSHPEFEARDFPFSPLTASMTANLAMLPTFRIIDEVLSGSVSGGSQRCGAGTSNFENGPCVRFTLPITHSGRVEATLQWDGGANDLDIYVFQGGRRLAAGQGATRNEERVSTDVGGSPVELRVVYYSGSTVQPFRIVVRRPN